VLVGAGELYRLYRAMFKLYNSHVCCSVQNGQFCCCICPQVAQLQVFTQMWPSYRARTTSFLLFPCSPK